MIPTEGVMGEPMALFHGESAGRATLLAFARTLDIIRSSTQFTS